jgi:hypothetical protein
MERKEISAPTKTVINGWGLVGYPAEVLPHEKLIKEYERL